MENKEQSIKNNKKAIFGMIIAALLLIFSMSYLILKNHDSKGSVNNKQSTEIVDKFYKYMESKNEKVIYYGSNTCGYCQLETPIMKQIKEDYDIDYLYIDATKLTSSDNKKILDILDSDGATPTIAVVKEDYVVDTNIGYLDGNDMVEFLKKNKVLDEDAVYTPEQYLTFIDYEEYENIVKSSDNKIVVIGQTTCSHCISTKPVLSHIAGKYNIEINYLNLTDMSSDEQTKLTDSLKEIGYENADNLGTPLTIIVKDNKLVNSIEGENPTSYFVREFKKSGIIE